MATPNPIFAMFLNNQPTEWINGVPSYGYSHLLLWNDFRFADKLQLQDSMKFRRTQPCLMVLLYTITVLVLFLTPPYIQSPQSLVMLNMFYLPLQVHTPSSTPSYMLQEADQVIFHQWAPFSFHFWLGSTNEISKKPEGRVFISIRLSPWLFLCTKIPLPKCHSESPWSLY